VAFRGDVAQIPISNIIQALFLNGQEGVLTVDSGRGQRRLRILKLGIRPLASKCGDPDLLRQAAVREKILTEAEFQNALSAWEPATLFPGDFLVRRRVITPDQVETQIRKQLEEGIFEVFTAKDLRYEFSAGEKCLEYELFDPEGLGMALIYSVNGLLMETARRDDEWRRIEQEIPSQLEVFAPVRGQLPASVPQEVDLAPRNYRELRHLISGERTIERMVAESLLSKYEVLHGLFLLKAHGFIRALDGAEKEALAEKLRRLVRNREAAEIYRSLLDVSPDDIRVRTQMISLLEKSKQPAEMLIENYLELVKHLEETDPAGALGYIEKVLQLKPHHLQAIEKLFSHHALEGNHAEALAAARNLVKAARAQKEHAAGAEAILKVINFYPEESQFFHDAAEMLLASGKEEMALDCLRSVARTYERRGEHQKLRKTYELIVKLDPAEASRLRRIISEAKRKEVKPRDLVRPAVFAGTAGLLLGVAGYFLYAEQVSRQAFAEVEKAVSLQVNFKDFLQAKRTLDDFNKTFPYSMRKSEASKLMGRVRKQEDETHEAERRSLESTVQRVAVALGKADHLLMQGEYDAAADLLSAALKETSGEELSAERKEHVGRLESLLEKVRGYIRSAQRLEQEAAVAARAGDEAGGARAHAVILRLLREFPDSPAAKRARIPVWIDSTPSGAAVLAGGERLAETPALIKLNPRKVTEVELARKGYRTHQLLIDPQAGPSHGAVLDKVAEWAFDSGGPIDGFPVAFGPYVYVANRNGRIFALSLDGRKAAEPFVLPLDISGGLGLWNSILYAGCFDGRLYLLNAGSLTRHGQPVDASPELLAIKHAPSPVSARGVVAVNCDGKHLSGIDLVTGRQTWLHTTTSPLLGAPQADRGRIYALTLEGSLLELDHDSGALVNAFRLEGPISHPGKIVNGKVFVVHSYTSLRALLIDGSKLTSLWSVRLGTAAVASPTVELEKSAVLVSLGSGQVVCLDAASGRERWTITLKSTLETEGTVFRNEFYAGTRSGNIVCLSLWDGSLLWSLETAGAREQKSRGIFSKGLISQGRFYQGSDDGHLYCITLE
jgi:outer membrane protein assembly factor BamB/tetratricopeptide (TPR) repeat protein